MLPWRAHEDHNPDQAQERRKGKPTDETTDIAFLHTCIYEASLGKRVGVRPLKGSVSKKRRKRAEIVERKKKRIIEDGNGKAKAKKAMPVSHTPCIHKFQYCIAKFLLEELRLLIPFLSFTFECDMLSW
jgi:hypothetical protein